MHLVLLRIIAIKTESTMLILHTANVMPQRYTPSYFIVISPVVYTRIIHAYIMDEIVQRI